MIRRRNKNRKTLGPIIIMIIISFVVTILSLILNKLGIQSSVTEAGTFETTIVTIKNIFSKEGIQYIFGDAVKNFRALEPLVMIVISLIAVLVLEASGLLKHIFGGLKNVRPSFITAIVLLISILSTIIGDYSYAILFPLIAVLYKIINRDPKLGIMTVFIGITAGYGAGIIYTYQDILLGGITELSAVDIINTYVFKGNSLMFISSVSAIALTIVGTILIEKNLAKKAKRYEEPELITSPQALKAAGATFLVLLVIAIYSVIPGMPLSGWLLDMSGNTYAEKLFNPASPFKDGFMVVFVVISLICGYVYGKVSRNIKNSREYNSAIAGAFQNTGFIFAGLFFASIMISILSWTNISTVLSLKLINLVGNNQMTGIFLILLMFIICIIVTMFNPSTVANWQLVSPVFVPLLMRANISPEFIQMIFKASDSIGKCLTPFNIFLIIMLGFLYKYDNENEELELFGTMKKLMPIFIGMTITWIIIILGWYLLGFNIGIGTSITL
jgi:Putative p-aminobenzoyl-glutamate transporter